MFQGLTVPIAAKICAAVLVVGGAGAATYEVVGTDGDSAATVVSDSPDTLAYADDAAKVKRTPDALDVEERKLPQWATDRKVPLEAEEEAEKAAEEEAKKKAAEEEAEKAAAEEEAKKKAAEEEAEKAAAEEEAKKKAEEEADNETWIEILWPEPESHYDDKVVVFEGKSEPGSKVFAGRYLANSDDDGNWRIELILSPGANKAVLKAEDAAGNLADDSITVWLDVEEEKHEDPKEKDPKHEEPKEDPKEEDPKEAVEVEFSAKQQYGECDAEVPYDVFWGTATPNSTVQISSDFGSATVEVNKDGHWEKKVWFEQAPRGTEFPVMVTADNGSKRFSFYAVPFEVEVPKEDPVEKLDGVDVEGHEGHEDPK